MVARHQDILGPVLVVVPCLVIPYLNEEKHIEKVVTRLLAEGDRLHLKIVIADGGSTDRTLEIARRLSKVDRRVVLMDDPKRIAAAVNDAMRKYGDGAQFLTRIDTHASYPDRYCEHLLQVQARTRANSVMVTMHTEGCTCFQRAAAATQNSMVGSGGGASQRDRRRRAHHHAGWLVIWIVCQSIRGILGNPCKQIRRRVRPRNPDSRPDCSMKTPNLPEHAISTPSVSVIMANYNGAAHLAEAITSVQRQSLWDLKIIVSDDASTDDSVRVVVGLAAEDHRIRIVRSDRNGGPAAAHNRALAVARGEWIAIMDSDDLMHPDGSRNWSTQRVGTAPVLSPTISSSSTRTAPAPLASCSPASGRGSRSGSKLSTISGSTNSTDQDRRWDI
jgi:glycosyltransferase involved in cell wall biosynthesis